MESNNAMMLHDNDYQIKPYANKDSYELSIRMAKSLAASTILPEAFQGPKGEANCLIAMELAGRLHISPFMCAQNLNVIYGRPSFSSTFLIAMINTSGLFKGSLRFEFSKNNTECYAWALDKETGERLEGEPISIEMAKRAGWHDRKGSQWPTIPGQMLRYRAAAFFARIYCPQITLGLQTREEIVDVGPDYYSSAETREERAKKISEELLGAPTIEADLQAAPPAESAPEPVTPDVVDEPQPQPEPVKEKKPTKAQLEKERKDRVAGIIDKFKANLGSLEAAQTCIIGLISKPNSKDWTEDDMAALETSIADFAMGAEAPDETPVVDAAFVDDDVAFREAEVEAAAFL